MPDIWVYASCAYATAGHFDFVVNALSIVLYGEKGEARRGDTDPVLWIVLARYKSLAGDQEGALKDAHIALDIARAVRGRDGKQGAVSREQKKWGKSKGSPTQNSHDAKNGHPSARHHSIALLQGQGCPALALPGIRLDAVSAKRELG